MEKMFSLFNKAIFTTLLCSLLLPGCQKDPADQPADNGNGSNAPTPYVLMRPPGFPAPYLSLNNPLTVEGVQLGSQLYFDPILSTNGRSCSSCHNREKSHSTPLFHSQSGFTISVPPHVNLAFKSHYNWEGSVTDLDTLCMADFEPEFFNTDAKQLYAKLNAHPTYPGMLKKAFGIQHIDDVPYYQLKVYLCYAISQYMRTLVSAWSKYDSVRLGYTQYTADEYMGMQIFFSERGDCFHCHNAPVFSDNDFHNNGLNETYQGFDQGRSLVTGKGIDLGKFLTPTLRNLTRTAPYMHDGRFATLEEVVEFYNSGVKETARADAIMNKRNNIRTLGLSAKEKTQLVAFLKTLNDESFAK